MTSALSGSHRAGEMLMTAVIARGCLLGPSDLRERVGNTRFHVPSFEVTGVLPQAFALGDLLDIPSSVPIDPIFAGTRLRVISRVWCPTERDPSPLGLAEQSVADGPSELRWELLLVCSDADPDETARRYLNHVLQQV